MEVFHGIPHFDFLGTRRIWIGISLALLFGSFYLWFATGEEKYGVDFRGGSEYVVRFKDPVTVGDLRKALGEGGFRDAIVQAFQSDTYDFSIRLAQEQSSDSGNAAINKALGGVKSSGFEILKEDFVGPVIGEKIRRDGLQALVASLIGMLIYIGFRFEWRYGVGALIALFHDVVIAVGACLAVGHQMTAGVLAALLTIVGYSVNDTVIIFDRVRENLNKAQRSESKKKGGGDKKISLIEVMNLSVNETLSRTIITALTVFFVVVTLWLFGGGAVSDLAFPLMIGVVVGTYSSVFVACAWVLLFEPKA